jgi:hypothetical protein
MSRRWKSWVSCRHAIAPDEPMVTSVASLGAIFGFITAPIGSVFLAGVFDFLPGGGKQGRAPSAFLFFDCAICRLSESSVRQSFRF